MLIVYCPVDDMQSSQTGFYTQLKHHTKIKIVRKKKKERKKKARRGTQTMRVIAGK